MKLKTAFGLTGWVALALIMAYLIWFQPEPPAVADPPTINDYIGSVQDDTSFSWFPQVVEVEVPVPYAVPGPIQYLPAEPELVYVDSSKEQLIALQDYIKRQYIFRLRYVAPTLQLSLISMDSVSADSVHQVYQLRQYELPPAFQVIPLPDGSYDVQRMELTIKQPLIKPSPFTYQTWGGVKLPLSVYVRQEAYWKNIRTSLELNVDSEALVTAQFGIGLKIR